MDPALQGAVSVDLNNGQVLEEEAEIFNHEVFPRRLRSTSAAFVVSACCDHVAGWAVGRSTHHLSNEVHLLLCNHISDTGDGVEHPAYFVVAEMLVTYDGY